MSDPNAPLTPEEQQAQIDAIADLVHSLTVSKYYMVASFVMNIYDILITLDIEVERIWKQKWTGATLLFIINRYLTPLLFIVIIVGFHLPAMSDPTICSKFAPFAGGGTVAAIAIVDLILILRTYALYGRSLVVLVILTALFIAQIAIMGWVVSSGENLPLPPGIVGCIFASRPGFDQFTISFHVATLIFETTVFGLTIARTIVLSKKSINTGLLTLIIRDGALYFFVIVFVNLLNVFFFIFMPVTLKPLNASFSHIMTTVLISRLIMNLRSGRDRPITTGASAYGPGGSNAPSRSIPQWGGKRSTASNSGAESEPQSFVATLIGTLGNPIDADEMIPLEPMPKRAAARTSTRRNYEEGYDYPREAAPQQQQRLYAPPEAFEDDVKPRTTFDYEA